MLATQLTLTQHCSFQKENGKKKSVWEGGWGKWGWRVAAAVMLFYGCFSCAHSILVCWPSLRLDPWFDLIPSADLHFGAISCYAPRIGDEAASPPWHTFPRRHWEPYLFFEWRQHMNDTCWLFRPGCRHRGKKCLLLILETAPLPPSSGDDGFHNSDCRSHLSQWSAVPESLWKKLFIFHQ